MKLSFQKVFKPVLFGLGMARKIEKKNVEVIGPTSPMGTVSENKMNSVEKKDVIEIPVGRFFSKMRANPWMPASIVLAIALVVVLFIGGGVNGGINGVSKEEVSAKLLPVLNAQVGGGVNLKEVNEKNGLYEVVVTYNGQDVPVYVTLDGENLITDPSAIVPIERINADNTDTRSNGPVNVEAGNSPVKGNANAPVTIIEFSDYQCPFCGKFYSETLSQIDEKYIKTGKVKLVYKDYPLSSHPEAEPAARAARCFGEQKGDVGYYNYHNKLFENQASLSAENYKKWANELGAGSQFDTCLDSGKYASDVQAELAYGSQLGVSGTPAFFINGINVEGAQPYSVFEQIIEAALAEVG